MANVSKTTNILEAAGFRGPVEGDIDGNVTGDLIGRPKLPTYTVANLPSAANNAGMVVRCSNGNAGAACVVVSDGANWKVIALGANAASA